MIILNKLFHNSLILIHLPPPMIIIRIINYIPLNNESIHTTTTFCDSKIEVCSGIKLVLHKSGTKTISKLDFVCFNIIVQL